MEKAIVIGIIVAVVIITALIFVIGRPTIIQGSAPPEVPQNTEINLPNETQISNQSNNTLPEPNYTDINLPSEI